MTERPPTTGPLSIAAFKDSARQFLERHAPSHRAPRRRLGLIEGAASAEDVDVARRWLACRFDHGFGWISGPVELGGAGLDAGHEEAYLELESHHQLPSASPFMVGRSMLAPAILAHGDADLQREHLPRLMRADRLACQLFSEPDAGSDLASVRTRARRDGDDWVVTGHKVWSSMAHLADLGEALVRTDPAAGKHAGLTMLLIDMRAPGVTVRPIRQMSGGAEFNEVILDEVRVKGTERLGAVGEGWQVALTTLGSERGSASSGDAVRSSAPFHRLRRLAGELGRHDDPLVRDALSRLFVGERIGELLEGRLRGAIGRGAPPALQALTKLQMVRQLLDAAAVSGLLLGPALVAGDDSSDWPRFVTEVPALRIAGGTDEIVRNTLAERALGLPRR